MTQASIARRCVEHLVIAGLLTSMLSCGGSSGGPTGPQPTDVASGSLAIASGEFFVASFSLDSRAPLRIEVDWSVGTNDLDAFVIRGTCTRDDILTAKPACTMDAVFVGSGTGLGKPETFTTPPTDPGAYTLLVVNRSSRDETCNYRISKAG